MATFIQNIAKIRGQAVYGTDMRTAIADAIQQALDLDIEGDGGEVFFTLTPIPDTPDYYTMEIDRENGAILVDPGVGAYACEYDSSEDTIEVSPG